MARVSEALTLEGVAEVKFMAKKSHEFTHISLHASSSLPCEFYMTADWFIGRKPKLLYRFTDYETSRRMAPGIE